MPVIIHATTACWPGLRYAQAMARLVAGTTEPLLGALSTAQVQLCPQNYGLLDEAAARELCRAYPQTRFRLHANVRVVNKRHFGDASSLCAESEAHFCAIGKVSAALGAPAYTLHAGRRSESDIETMARNVRTLQDRYGIPVGVEALYPAAGDPWLLSTWAEYRWLLESGLYYALDLSHIAILARRTRHTDMGLCRELVASDRALEIHLSDNDGLADQHRPIAEPPWWWPLLDLAPPSSTLFSEGNQVFGERRANTPVMATRSPRLQSEAIVIT